MISLQLVLEPFVNGVLSPVTVDLARALIATAPPECTVTGVVSSSARPQLDAIRETLPELELKMHKLPYAVLKSSWQSGIGSAGGFTHSPSLLAPRPSLDGGQTVVTLNAWPGSKDAPRASLRRLARLTNAVIVPTSAHAEMLRDAGGADHNIAVIPAAPRSAVIEHIHGQAAPVNRIVVETTDPQPVERSHQTADDIEVVEIGKDLPFDRRGELLSGAVAYVPAAEGLGVEVLEALSAGVSIVAPELPWARELAGDAFLAASSSDTSDIVAAVSSAVADRKVRKRLTTTATDRAKFFSWESHAEQVWQLHADL